MVAESCSGFTRQAYRRVPVSFAPVSPGSVLLRVRRVRRCAHAFVAQGIEHWFPVPGVAGSNPAEGARPPLLAGSAACRPVPEPCLARLSAWYRLLRRLAREYRTAHGRTVAVVQPRTYTREGPVAQGLRPRPALPAAAGQGRRSTAHQRARSARTCWSRCSGSDAARRIPFDDLVPPYVLKSTHASGHVVLVDSILRSATARRSVAPPAAGWRSTTAQARPSGATRGCARGWSSRPDRRRRAAPGAPGVRLRRHGRFVVNTVVTEDGRIRNAAFHDLAWNRLRLVVHPGAAPGAWPRARASRRHGRRRGGGRRGPQPRPGRLLRLRGRDLDRRDHALLLVGHVPVPARRRRTPSSAPRGRSCDRCVGRCARC